MKSKELKTKISHANSLTLTLHRSGTPDFMAPEMVGARLCDEKVDVWGVGVMVFALLCGDMPFEDTAENYSAGKFQPLYDLILKGDLKFTLKCWTEIHPSAQVMLRAMLTVDPKKRLSFQQVLSILNSSCPIVHSGCKFSIRSVNSQFGCQISGA